MKKGFIVQNKKGMFLATRWRRWSGNHFSRHIGKAETFDTRAEAEEIISQFKREGVTFPDYEIVPASGFYEVFYRCEDGGFYKSYRPKGSEETYWNGYRTKRKAAQEKLQQARKELKRANERVKEAKQEIRQAEKAMKGKDV